jgi:hypothetical protein
MKQRTVAISLAIVSFALHLTLARQLRDLGVFDRNNVFFDADVHSRLRALSAGNHLGIKHPNLMPYFTPPVMLIAKVLAKFVPSAGSQAELQAALGALVVPLASAFTTVLVFSLLRGLELSLVQAVVATLLAVGSFSSLIFWSVPESFGLTALAMAMAYDFAIRSRSELTPARITGWIAIGVSATGLTLTNVVFVALLLWATVWSRDARLVTTLRVAGVVVVMFALTGISAYVLDRLVPHAAPSAIDVRPLRAVDGKPPSASIVQRVIEPIESELGRYVGSDMARKLRRFPTSIADAFAPPAVETDPIRSVRWNRPTFTLEGSPSIFGLGNPLGTSTFLLVVAGAACWLAAPSTRAIATASVGIIGFSWLLSVWGRETFLYSQHWHLAAVVLVAGVMRASVYSRLMTVVLATLTLCIAINNFVALKWIFAVLAAAPR